MNIEEKVTRGVNYTVSLPSPSDNSEICAYFTRYYTHMRELCENFAASDPARVRNYKCSYMTSASKDMLVIEIFISARIKERGSPPVSFTRKLTDTWARGLLISHICSN